LVQEVSAMIISDILSRSRKNKRSKRVGRGIGSGHGKTCCRGSKGLQSRAGGAAPLMAEGGQMPLFRRIPKRGFSNAAFRVEYQVVNVGTLSERFDDGAKVNPASLAAAGLIASASEPVKILGTGDLKKKLDVEATSFSKSAEEKIAQAGGQARKAS
jgi:large subunit ribosomal protein L15